MIVNSKVKIKNKVALRTRDLNYIKQNFNLTYNFTKYNDDINLKETEFVILKQFEFNGENYSVVSDDTNTFLVRNSGLKISFGGGDDVQFKIDSTILTGHIVEIDGTEPKYKIVIQDEEIPSHLKHRFSYYSGDRSGIWVRTENITSGGIVDKPKENIKQDNLNISELTNKISELTETIKQKERMQDLLNETIIEKGKEIAIEDLKENLKKELDNFIQQKYGILPKVIEVKTEKTRKEITGIFHKEFPNICRIVESDIPLMLVGGAGAGKNFTLEQVSEALGLDFYFSNAVNQEYKLTGFIDANGKYHETEFYKAFTKGGMFFLDEIDASCPECLVILNSAIANRYFDFPTGRVKAHKDFRVVCAGNTFGTGADMVYVGRNVLDGATLDRFVVLQFDYDDEVEKQLAYDEELFNFIKDLRKAIDDSNLRYIVSMRALINATKLLELGMDKTSILRTTIIKNMQTDDLNVIMNKLKDCDWKSALKKMCDGN